MLPENYLVKTNSKEETSEVIVFFDPNEKTDWTHWEYVSVNKEATEITNIWNIIPEKYSDYPVYEFSEWKRLLIPEKWCIKSTPETRKELMDFIVSKGYSNPERRHDYMIHYPFTQGGGSLFAYLKEGYTEITFEQFKQITMNNVKIKKGDKLSDLNLVEKNITCYKNSLGDVLGGCTYNLNNYKDRKITKVENGYFEVSSFNYGWFKIEEAIESMKKIIGYNIKKEFSDKETKFSKLLGPGEGLIDGEIWMYADGSGAKAAKELGVLELWFDPIYEKEILSKTIEIGTQKRKAEVFKDKVVVTDGDGEKRTFNNSQILELESQFNKKLFFSGFNTMITKIHIGCDAGIELELDDLVLIIKTQKEL